MVTFVGATTDHSAGGTLFNGTATPVAPMPAGIAAGDVAIVSMDFFGSATTVTLAGYASQLDNTGTASDHRIVYTITLAGSETSVAPTMSTSTWGTLEVMILRGLSSSTPTNKVSQATSFASGGGNFTNPSLTIGSSTDATVYGYPATASGNSSANQPAFTATPASLSNWTSDAASGPSDGAAQGIGWGVNISAPGTATVNIPGPTTGSGLAWALDFPAAAAAISPPLLVQPGGKQWRRKFRHRQVLLPVAVNPNLTVNAGLATAAGAALDNTNASGLGIGFTAALAPAASAAGQPNLGINTGLATGTGSAGSPSAGVNAGLATGTGAAFGPATAVNTGLATGTGTAGSPNIGIDAGLAMGTGSSAQPGIAWTPGLASAIGAAGGLSMAAGAGLATATGAAAQLGTTWTPGLATGTGAAGSPNAGINAGLATAIGAAAQPATPRAIGLATGTGAASLPNTGFNIGLATGTGTAFNIPAGIPAGLATAIGTAFGPATAKNIGLATGIGSAGSPAVGIYAGLATAIGAAAQPGIAWTAILAHGTGTAAQPAIPRIIGLATGTGSAFLPFTGFNIGLATGTGTAFNITRFVFVRHNVDYTGSTLTAPNTLGGTLSVFTLGGTLSVANTLGGTATVTANTLGGTTSVFTLGGTLAVTPDPLTGTLSVAVNTLSGTTVEDKMQEIDITLNEYNDATVTFQILNNGSPDNITGMTVQALFKKTRGDLDSAPTTKTYSSSGGSPAITINTPTTGSCTWAVPDADVIFGNVTFYRIDVVSSGLITTAIFGTVTVTQL